MYLILGVFSVVVILVLRTLCYNRHWIKYIKKNPRRCKLVSLLSNEHANHL